MKRTPRTDADFRAEIEAHLALEEEQLIDEGLSPAAARAEARRRFGNMTRTTESFYEGNRFMWLDHLVRDLRLAARQLRSTPIATALIVVSLALAISFNTSIFSIADQALLRSLPIEDPRSLHQVEWDGQFIGQGAGNVGFGSLIPIPLFRELEQRRDVFESLFARSSFEVHLGWDAVSRPVSAELATGSYFDTLGLQPALGRLLGPADDRTRLAHPQVVLSFDLWSTAFAESEDVLGRKVTVNGFPMEVAGVAPRGFAGTDRGTPAALWIPMLMKPQVTPAWDGLESHRTRFAHVFGRLQQGLDAQGASARLQPAFDAYLQEDTRRERWPELTPQQEEAYFASRLRLVPGGDGQSFLKRQVERPLWILTVTTFLIFLLACLNVANLSLARTLRARAASTLQVALGAPRRRLLVQSFTESLVLSVLGCGLGLLASPWVGNLVLSYLGADSATLGLHAGLDRQALLIALGLGAATTILVGMAPALFAANAAPMDVLKRGRSGSSAALGLRRGLVVAQFCLALVLLLCAGLFSQSLDTLRAQGPGYPTANLLMFRLAPTFDGVAPEQVRPLMEEVLREITALPDVQGAGAAWAEMLRGGGWNNPVTVQAGTRVVTDESLPMNAVSPGFFDTLGARVVQGRNFDARDSQDTWNLRSAIVNEEFVRRYVPGGSPIGARLGFGNRRDADVSIEIVGVVSDFRDYGLREPEAQVYFSLWERPFQQATFYVRSRTSSDAAMQALRSRLAEVRPGMTLLSLRTIDDQLDRLLAGERMLAALGSAFAALATILALIGIYGVLSFSAEQRTKEIGIRIALGSSSWAAARLVLREATLLAGLGVGLAVPVIALGAGAVESQLYGVPALDPKTLLGATLVLFTVGLLASAVPARRVGGTDPLQALRAE